MAIDRCVCFNVSFCELVVAAKSEGLDLDGITKRFGCGRGCALCLPYIRAALATGQTEFSADRPIGDGDSMMARDDAP